METKFPGREITDACLKLTCPLEVKYELFNKCGIIEKVKTLSNSEVSD